MVIYYIVFPHYTCDEVPPVKIIEEGQHFGGGHFSERIPCFIISHGDIYVKFMIDKVYDTSCLAVDGGWYATPQTPRSETYG